MDSPINTTNDKLVEQEAIAPDASKPVEDSFKDAIETQLKKVQRQNLLIGAQTICSVILEKILAAENKSGKLTLNDYRRLVKDIKSFCQTGLSRKVNTDGNTEPTTEETTVDETIQN